MGFVEDVNRLNVALTRPRRKLIVVGNMASLILKRGLLSKYVEEASTIGCLYSYSKGMIARMESSIRLQTGS